MTNRPVWIFDFDGTIADSLGEVLGVYNSVAQDLGVAPVSSQRFQQLRKLDARSAMRELDVPLWKVPRIMSAVRKGLRARASSLQPVEGMPDALRKLWDTGAKTAIVSSNSKDNVSAFLVRNGLDRFEVLSCAASMFGKAGRLRRMARRLAVAEAQCFYVGDELRDVRAAADAGMQSVAVSWGYSDRAALAAQSPAHLVDAPSQLLTIFTGA